MNLYPYIENYLLLCYTWNQPIPQFSKLRINPNKNTGSKQKIWQNLSNYFLNFLENLFMLVHKEGHFNAASKTDLTELLYIPHIMDSQPEIEVKKLISTSNMECQDGLETYDLCSEMTIRKRWENNCIPPFLIKLQNISNCTMHAAFNIFQTSPEECLIPCSQIKVNIKQNPVDWLYILVNPKLPINTVIPGYYLTIPSYILYSEMQESYTAISFIAEFGGWAGLFLGVSVIGVFEFIMNKFSNISPHSLLKKLTSTSFMLLKLACASCVIFILITSCKKLINKEKELNVKIQEGIPDLSISFCSVKNVYAVPFLRANLSYIGNHSSFWYNATSLSEKLKRLVLILENGKKITVYDSFFTILNRYKFDTMITAKYESYLETCHTLNLKHWTNIKTIQFTAKQELSIYVHMPGELLRPGRQGFSFINSATVKG